MDMNSSDVVAAILFAAASVVAIVGAFAKAKARVFRDKVEPLLLAAGLAAAGLFAAFTTFR